jgi:hypothetical protein
MEPSAFTDKHAVPTDAAVDAMLGSGVDRWRSLRAGLDEALGPLDASWAFSGKAYGWSLRLGHRGRAVVYLTPLSGRFRASLALPERSMAEALAADLPSALHAVVMDAPLYAEGRAIRLEIVTDDDVAGLMTLARIRMRG